MRSIHKRVVIALAAAPLVAAGAAGTLAAHAAGPAPDSVSCTFNGATTALTPIPAQSVFAPSPSGSTEEGTSPITTADGGTYTFSGATVACTGVDSNGNTATATHISSSGNYYNVECGTGTAYGTATLTDASGATVATVKYTIVFANGQGTLTADVTIATDGVTIDAAGPVSITPSNTGGCVTTAVTGFNVVGSVSGSGTGDTDDAA